MVNDNLSATTFPPQKFFTFDGLPKLPCSIDLLIDYETISYQQALLLSDTSLYFHPFYEIMIIQSDDLQMQINEKIYSLKRNDLIIFRPQDFHRAIIKDGQCYTRWMCEFSYEYIEAFHTQTDDIFRCFRLRDYTYCHILHLDEATAHKLLDKFYLIREIKTCLEYGHDILLRCELVRMLLRINQLFDALAPRDEGTLTAAYQKLRPILYYINRYLSAELSLDMLSKEFYISKYYLCRIFKEIFGYTVNEYITYRRIAHAAALLRNGASVTQACKAVTPEGTSHFISVFKKLVGTTPKQYAKQYQD